MQEIISLLFILLKCCFQDWINLLFTSYAPFEWLIDREYIAPSASLDAVTLLTVVPSDIY